MKVIQIMNGIMVTILSVLLMIVAYIAMALDWIIYRFDIDTPYGFRFCLEFKSRESQE